MAHTEAGPARFGSPRSAAPMPPNPSNTAIAEALEELGDLYELDGAVVHRVLAYRNAARSVLTANKAMEEGRVIKL